MSTNYCAYAHVSCQSHSVVASAQIRWKIFTKMDYSDLFVISVIDNDLDVIDKNENGLIFP